MRHQLPLPARLAILAVLAALLMLAGCRRRGDDGDSAPTVTSSGARIERGSMEVDGRERSWRLFVPASVSGDDDVALVIGLHGGLGSGEQFAEDNHVDEQAEAGGFIAVYPEGLAGRLNLGQTWNGGRCCGYAADEDVDDVPFIEALIDRLAADYPIDRSRVYAVGHSNGAIMAYRLACEIPERIAAIGAVAGSLEVDCEPSMPVSILSIHGDADENHPLEGGSGRRSIAGVDFTPVAASLDRWVELNGCAAPPVVTTDGDVTTTRWADCEGGAVIESQVIHGANHGWPGGERLPFLGPSSDAIDASAVLWGFLSTKRR
jgi:polyhydroxybutyrate depolymerase